MAVIPNDFSLIFGDNPQYSYVDYNVTHEGHPSIRVEPDLIGVREVNGKWYHINAGDHLVAKSWMRVLTNSSTPGYPQCGARFGIDFYGTVNGVHRLLTASDFWNDYFEGNFSKMYVSDHKNGEWQQRVIDIIVPAQAKDSNGNVGNVTDFVMWLQGAPWGYSIYASNVWFANTELYINPTPPLIVLALGNNTISAGQNWTIYAEVSGGNQPYTYQWFKDDSPLQGHVSQYLTITVNELDTVNYYCQVTDANGVSVTSNNVTLMVTPTSSPPPSPTPTPTISPTLSPSPTPSPYLTMKPTTTSQSTLTPTPTFSPSASSTPISTSPAASLPASPKISDTQLPVDSSKPHMTKLNMTNVTVAVALALIVITVTIALFRRRKSFRGL